MGNPAKDKPPVIIPAPSSRSGWAIDSQTLLMVSRLPRIASLDIKLTVTEVKALMVPGSSYRYTAHGSLVGLRPAEIILLETNLALSAAYLAANDSNMTRSESILIAVCSVILGALGASAGEFPDSWTWDDDPKNRASHAALEGKPMPTLDLSGWINGEVKPADMKGKVVVVDFYATWCGPCMKAIPHNNELLKKYKDKGLIIVGICASDRGQEKMPAVVKDKGIQYPTARDAKLKSEKAWQVNYYPTYALVDRKGIVRVVGLQPDNVEKVVKKLLAEPAP